MSRKYIYDHDSIREWIEGKGGRPAVFNGEPEFPGDEDTDTLHISFAQNDDLEEISWEELSQRMNERDLALYYNDEDPLDFGFISKSEIIETPEKEESESEDGDEEEDEDDQF